MAHSISMCAGLICNQWSPSVYVCGDDLDKPEHGEEVFSGEKGENAGIVPSISCQETASQVPAYPKKNR